MISFFSTYIKNIAVFIALISFFTIIVPGGKYKNYIQMILGLLLVFLILNPVSQLIYGDQAALEELIRQTQRQFHMTEGFDGDEGARLHRDMISTNFQMILQNQLKQMFSDTDYRLTDVEVSYSNETGEIFELYMEVSERTPTPTARAIIRIESVEVAPIHGNRRSERIDNEDQESEEIKKLKTMISDFYNLNLDNIYITEQKKKQGDGALG